MKPKQLVVSLGTAFQIVAFAVTCQSVKPTEPTDKTLSSEEICLPAHTSEDAIVEHYAYTLQYNEEHEEADWVAYVLTTDEAQGTILTGGSFRMDPLIETESARDDDYTTSGFSRGHLAPAADMKWSELAMYESYYMSNVSPQLQPFNNGIWKRLEYRVRDWAIENGEVLVVTGPVLRDGLPRIKSGVVSIPEYFYKVIVDIKEPGFKGIGYIMPHEASDQPLEAFAVTIDSVEAHTGIDFFPGLPDSLEEELESSSFTTVSQ